MRLSKKVLGFVVAILVVWVVVLAGLVYNAASSDARFDRAGALEHTVEVLDEQGLTISAISPADVYGEEWIAGAILCSRQTAAGIAETFDDVEQGQLGELGDGEIPDDTNYLMLRSADGDLALDPIDRAVLDLCQVPLQGYFDTRSMMPVAKTETGAWALLV